MQEMDDHRRALSAFKEDLKKAEESASYSHGKTISQEDLSIPWELQQFHHPLTRSVKFHYFHYILEIVMLSPGGSLRSWLKYDKAQEIRIA